MGTLVSRNATLLRRDGYLVRSPIYTTLTLEPDEMAYYMIAGAYSNGWPQRGFVNTPTASGSSWCGDQVVKSFFTPYSSSQIWRQVQGSGAMSPNNVFYQGRFSTFAPIPYQSEAFEMFCAYHFTLPEKYKDSTVLGVRWTVEHKGEIMCYQNARAANSQNFFCVDYASKGSTFSWMAGTGWDTPYWEQHVGLYQSLNNNVVTMYNNAQSTVTLETGAKSGTPKGWEVVWSSAQDGSIPICSTPYYRTYMMDDTFVNAFNTNKGGWIVSIPRHDTSEGEPGFDIGENNLSYWGCSTFRTYNIGVDIQVVE